MQYTLIELNSRNQSVIKDMRTHYQMHRTLARAFPDEPRLLFRIDNDTDGSPRLWLLTESDFSARNRLGDYVDMAHRLDLPNEWSRGDTYEFRLWASPVIQRHIHNSRGKRCNIVGASAQIDWLHRQGERGGFAVMDAGVRRSFSIGGDSRQATHEAKSSIPHVGVEFEGLLRVNDPTTFAGALRAGIGRAKAFGFGLLLLDLS